MAGRLQRRARLAVPAILGLGVLYGALSLRIAPPRTPAAVPARATASHNDDPRSTRARALIRAGSAATASLVDAYGSWAADPAAVPARGLVLRTLFRRLDGPFGIESALSAIEADATAPARDPLWSEVVELLAGAWRGARADRGLDLIVAESRPRARRAVIASFAHLINTERGGELSDVQRQTLVNRLIDLYPGLQPEQQPEVDQALRSIASDDVADILLGHGLDSEDDLDGPRERKLALAETQQTLAEHAAQGELASTGASTGETAAHGRDTSEQ